MRADHELTIALLKACGVPHDRVRSVVFRSDVGGLSELEVTYLAINVDPSLTPIETTIRFRQVIE